MENKPAHPRRQSSIDEGTAQMLEKQLQHRPDKAELVERNILKDDHGIDPSLVAAREKLQRSQLEDKLDHALQQRPQPEELIKEGILPKDDAPSSIGAT